MLYFHIRSKGRFQVSMSGSSGSRNVQLLDIHHSPAADSGSGHLASSPDPLHQLLCHPQVLVPRPAPADAC